VRLKPYSVISQSIRSNVAVCTAASSRRSAWMATIEPGLSMRIHGTPLPWMTSSQNPTVAHLWAAVPVNAVSPWPGRE
jgi:hypothetical protein